MKALGVGEPDQGQYDALEDLQPAPLCVAIRWSVMDRLSRQGPWVPDEANAEQAVSGILRRLRGLHEKGKVIPEAVAWRLAARPGIR